MGKNTKGDRILNLASVSDSLGKMYLHCDSARFVSSKLRELPVLEATRGMYSDITPTHMASSSAGMPNRSNVTLRA